MIKTIRNPTSTQLKNRPRVAVIGAGYVGQALAISIADFCDVTLFDRRKITEESIVDPRTIALSASTESLFEHLRLWDSVREDVTPIERILVSEAGRFFSSELVAPDDAPLGYVIEGCRLHQHLQSKIHRLIALGLIRNNDQSSIQAVHLAENDHHFSADLVFSDQLGEHNQSFDFVVSADGNASIIQQKLGFAPIQHDYHQTAITAHLSVETERPYEAIERFTKNGPIAILPFGTEPGSKTKRMGLVLCVPTREKERFISHSDSELIHYLQSVCKGYLPQILGVKNRYHFDLSLQIAPSLTIGRQVICLGNAANSLHPVAGQGLNLAYRDVTVLASLLYEVANGHIKALDVTKRYTKKRHLEHQNFRRITDALVRGFGVDLPFLNGARQLALAAFENHDSLKRSLRKRLQGYHSEAALDFPSPSFSSQASIQEETVHEAI